VISWVGGGQVTIINIASLKLLKTKLDIVQYLFAVPGRGRYGKFWPVVDMVPISGSFKKTIHPVLQPIKKLVLEYGKMVWAIQHRGRLKIR